MAVHAQGKFWEHQGVLCANQHDVVEPAPERYAKEVELDLARFPYDVVALDEAIEKAMTDR